MISKTEAEITARWGRLPFDPPVVSIRCMAYEHERYIGQCLDSLLMQETDFPFEIVVHDDASSDNTAGIIREYESRYPHIIRAIYETENQYSKDRGSVPRIIDDACRGEYMAFCEGDDYWIDPQKLQAQRDIMERRPEISLCCNTVVQTDENGAPTGVRYPVKNVFKSVIELQDYLDYRGYPLQTSGYFLRSSLLREYRQQDPAFVHAANIGDKPLCLYMLTRGPIYWLDREMSCYRRFSEGSWSRTTLLDPDRHRVFLSDMISMMQLFDAYTGHRYDCHLDTYRWNYCFFNDDYRSLLRPEFQRVRKRKGPFICFYVYVCAAFPFIAKAARPLLDENVRRTIKYRRRMKARKGAPLPPTEAAAEKR